MLLGGGVESSGRMTLRRVAPCEMATLLLAVLLAGGIVSGTPFQNCQEGEKQTFSVGFKICRNGHWINTYCPTFFNYDVNAQKCVWFQNYIRPINNDLANNSHRPHSHPEPTGELALPYKPSHRHHPQPEPTDKPRPSYEPSRRHHHQLEPSDEPRPSHKPTHRPHARPEPTGEPRPSQVPSREPYPHTEATSTSQPICKDGEREPIVDNCSHYLECVNGTLNEKGCTFFRHFDSVKKECMFFGYTCAKN